MCTEPTEVQIALGICVLYEVRICKVATACQCLFFTRKCVATTPYLAIQIKQIIQSSTKKNSSWADPT